MIFLTPIPALLAASVALPALLLLYFLKLRRLPKRVPTTMLWMKSVEDLQVNAPFQRLRLSLLFLLQLLLLLLLLAAMARPVIGGAGGPGRRTIIIIDRSASMNTIDGEGGQSRLDVAKAEATNIVNRIASGDDRADIMLIAAGRTSRVVSPFDSNTNVLRAAIGGIEPTDEELQLAEALKLADAFALSTGEEGGELPVVVVISDGGVGDGQLSVSAKRVEYIRIGPGAGQSAFNIGITACSARRVPDDPASVDVFVRLINTSEQPVESTLTLRVDGQVERSVRISLPGSGPTGPGEFTTTLQVVLPDQGVITVNHGVDDALVADNVAAVVVPELRSPRVLVVTPSGGPDPFLISLLEAADVDVIGVRTLDGYVRDQADGSAPQRGSIDLLVFDRVAPLVLPDISSLTLGAVPPPLEVIKPTATGGHRVLSWDRRHPMMQHVGLDNLIYSGFGAYSIPIEVVDRVDVLATGSEGPLMVQLKDRRAVHVAVGFDLVNSTWPADVSLLVFMSNVLDQLAMRGGGQEGLWHQPGEAVAVSPQVGAERMTIDGPATGEVEVAGRSTVTLPIMRATGIYGVAGAQPPYDVLAINLASDLESDIRPRDELPVNAGRVSTTTIAEVGQQELWPWCILGAFGLLVLEWLVYSWKVSRGV